MTDNIYDAPESDLVPDQGSGPEFFRVGKRKLIIMAIFTFGIYSLYWYYRHWDAWRKYHQASLWPVPRAVFSIFFVLPLFRRIDEAARREGLSAQWSYRSNAWAIILIGLVLSFGIPFFFGITTGISGAAGADSGFITNMYILVLASSVLGYLFPPLFMSKAQVIANEMLSADSEADPNEKITLANIGWIILGVLLTGMGLVNDMMQITALSAQ